MGWGSLSCCSEQSGWLLWSLQTVLTITADVGWRYKALFAVAFQDPHPTISFVLLHDAQQLSLCDGYGALAVAWKKQKRDPSEQKRMRIVDEWRRRRTQTYLQSCTELCTGRGEGLRPQTRHQTLCKGSVFGQLLHHWIHCRGKKGNLLIIIRYIHLLRITLHKMTPLLIVKNHFNPPQEDI